MERGHSAVEIYAPLTNLVAAVPNSAVAPPFLHLMAAGGRAGWTGLHRAGQGLDRVGHSWTGVGWGIG